MIARILFRAYGSTFYLIGVEVEKDAEFITDDDHVTLRKDINKSTTVRNMSNEIKCELNRLNRTGHVMHQQFNIQQLYVLPTLYLCVLYLSENKQRLVPLTA